MRKIVRIHTRPLIEALRTLGRAGYRLPSVRLGRYRVGLDSSNRRLYARSGKLYLGEARVGGVFRPSKDATAADIESLRLIIELTLEVARGSAILLGMKARCAVCNRILDSKDRLRGIGEGCYRNGEFWRLEEKASVGRRGSSKLGYVRSSNWPYAKRRTKNQGD